MKLEEQIVSLELAKKLKQLGFSQESLFKWGNVFDHAFMGDDVERPEPEIRYQYLRGTSQFETFKPICSAYTVAELGEMLPQKFYSFLSKDTGHAWCYISDSSKFAFVQNTMAMTEADARAKMLIHLKENDLIK